MTTIIDVIWIVCLSIFVTDQTQLPDGDPHRETVCADASLSLSCVEKQAIIVENVQYGTKPTQVCSQGNKTTGCCDYVETDCFLPYESDVIGSSCSGRERLCSPGYIAATDSSRCGAPVYPVFSHYLTTEYKCIPTDRIGESYSASLSSTGKMLYLKNSGYPTSKVKSTEISSNCSVETKSCSSQISIYLIHLQLADGVGQCTGGQQLIIEDRDVTRTYTCSNNTNYVITHAFTSSSNYLRLELKNPNGVNDGYFWIGFEETDTTAELTLHCPHAEQTICMDCPPLSNILDGTVSTDSGRSTYQNATYLCNNGYRLIGESVRTCQENGNWDKEAPTCQIIECAELNSPANGNVSTPGGRTYGEIATYSCQYGYRLDGTSSRVCGADGSWNGSEPNCVLIECPALNSPDNGNVTTPGGRTYGEIAIYSCQYGYRLDGTSSRVCESDGSWNGSEPNCVLIVCPALTDPVNGSVTVGTTLKVDQTANYTCDHKFRLDGDAVRVCQYNATWSSEEPVCTLIVCQNLTAPENGTVTLSGNTLGETARYSCKHGYTLSDGNNRTCGHDGTWSGSDPLCLLKTCDPLPVPANGNVSTEWLAIGKTATYSCSLGYILTGDETRVCQSDYTWSGAEPVCEPRALGSDCTTESDCSAAVSGSTCNDSVCVCAEGLIERAGGCVTVEGETKETPDDGLSQAVIIIIAVAAVVVLVAIIAIVVVCRRKKKADTPKSQTENGRSYDNNAYSNDIPMSNETWIVTDKAKTATAIMSPTIRTPEHIEENETAPPRETANVLNEAKQQETVSTNNDVIQRSDADQSDRSVIQISDVNTVMAEDESHVERTSRESESLHTDNISHEAVPEPEMQTETVCTPVVEDRTRRTEIKDATADTLVATSGMDAIEQEIKEADMKINLDSESSQVSGSIKDLAAALFRSASVAKRNLIARGRAGDIRFEFETTEDSEWSKGLLAAAKEVMAAIYNLCNIANDLAEDKTDDEMLEAAAQEIRRATNVLIVAYRVEGDLESSTLKELKDACIAVSNFADSIVKSAIANKPDSHTSNRKSVALDDGEVQKAKRKIEAHATVLRKEKELEEARRTKEELNQQLNKYDKNEDPEIFTEL